MLSGVRLSQIRAPCFGPLPPLLASPILDATVIAREEDFGDLPAPKAPGPGVLGFFEQAFSKGLGLGRGGIAHHPGKEAGDSLDDCRRRDLTAGQHEVPEGDLFINQMLGDPLVNSFVPATNQYQIGKRGQPVEMSLIEPSPRGAQQDFVSRSEGCQRIGKRLNHHHHAGSPAEGSIVDLAMGSLPELPEIDQFNLKRPSFNGSADDGGREGPTEEPGEERDDRDLQRESLGSPRILSAMMLR